MDTRVPVDVNDEPSPDRDARNYIEDVIQTFLRDAALSPDEEFTEGNEDFFQPEGWEMAEEYFLDHPEALVGMGLISDEDIDNLDEDWVIDIAFQIHEQQIASDMKDQDAFEQESEEFLQEDEGETSWFGESIAVISELLREARDALNSTDTERLMRVLNSLCEEMGLEPENLGEIEHWTELLVSPTALPAKEDNETKKVRQLVFQAVRYLAARLCEIIAYDGKALQYIEWRQLEEVVATALEGIGFDVLLTPPSKDGGKDVIASCILHGRKFAFFIEVKHWRSGKRVNTKSIFDFVEINVSSSTDGGLFLSTSGYEKSVFTHLSELQRGNIRLGDEQKVIALCQHFTRRGQGLWTPEHCLPEILFESTVGAQDDKKRYDILRRKLKQKLAMSTERKLGIECGQKFMTGNKLSQSSER